MHSSISIAKRIVDLAGTSSDTVTPMQLMKLVYLCHGWMLGIHGRQLVKEPVEAWLYGPVIPELYQRIRHYRSSPVKEIIDENDDLDFDEMEESIIKQVYEKYGKYSGPVLSTITHEVGSPWYITWNTFGKNSIISNDIIEDYYHRLYIKNNAAA